MIVPDCSEADDDGDDCVNDENNDFSEVVSTKGGDSDNVPSYYGSDIDEDTHVGVDFEEDSCEGAFSVLIHLCHLCITHAHHGCTL